MQAHSSADASAGAVALSSVDWVLDGSGVAVMDSCGRLALLDIHGVTYSIQSAAQPGWQPGQLAQARLLLAPAFTGANHASLLLHFMQNACMHNLSL